MKKSLLIVVSLAMASFSVAKETGAEAAFAKLKSLVGEWNSTVTGQEGKVTYRLTGAGSALVETLLPGTPSEMISMFHLDNGRLLMTHYCAVGNQPTLVLKPANNPNVLTFDFLRGTNMKPTDMHMHALKITFKGENEIVTEWTSFDKGKPGMVAKFELKRKAAK